MSDDTLDLDSTFQHGLSALDRANDATTSQSTERCTATSLDHVHSLLQAAAKPNLSFLCPLCKQPLGSKKSFIRHVKSVIEKYQGSPYQCRKCNVRCARKDILTRHLATMHAAPSSDGSILDFVRCVRCGRPVRPRSLKGHQASARCIAEAEATNRPITFGSDREGADLLVSLSDEYMTISRNLHEILDCELLTGWLFAKLQPWGRGQDTVAMWHLQGSASYTYETLILKDWALRAIRMTASHPDAAGNGRLFDSIILLMAVVVFTDGWHYTWPHQEVLLRLVADMQLASKPAAPIPREVFVDRPLSDALTTVTFQSVRESERCKCQQVFQMVIHMLRSSAYDYMSQLSDSFHSVVPHDTIQHQAISLRPEQFAASYGHHMVAISEVAAAVELA